MFWNVSCLNKKPKTLVNDEKKIIIGFGLPRTGTSSLSEALYLLGYRSHHFPIHFIKKETLYRSQKNAFLDWITLGFRPKQLIEMFPNAIYIHTFRDVDSWIKSMAFLKKLLLLCPPILAKFNDIYGPQTNWKKFYNDFENDIKDISQQHHHSVLHLNICQNPTWNQLCEFLNIPIPQNKKFPHKKEIFLQLQQIFR
jgi:hypothetical protein